MEFQELIAEAKKVVGTRVLFKNVQCGMVAASLLTSQGNLYTGICIDMYCSTGYCAERQAAGEMLKNKEAEVVKMVAINDQAKVIPPCGVCREFISQINPQNSECEILLDDKGTILKLKELLNFDWKTSFFK